MSHDERGSNENAEPGWRLFLSLVQLRLPFLILWFPGSLVLSEGRYRHATGLKERVVDVDSVTS